MSAEAVVEHDPSHIHDLARSTMRSIGKFLTAGASEHGTWRIEYELRDGEVGRVFTHHGPIGQDELAEAPA